MTAIVDRPMPLDSPDRDEVPRRRPRASGAIRRRIPALISIVSWLYLTVLGCLAMWVVGASLLFGWSPHLTTSDSMSPALRTGDIVLTADPGDEPLGLGSIVVFDSPGGRIVHRVTEVADDGSYRTRGDANAVEDPTPVEHAEVVGSGRLLVPFVGLPASWYQTGEIGKFLAWLGLTLLGVVLAPSRTSRWSRR